MSELIVVRFGPRFLALNNSYDVRLRQMAMECAKEMGIAAHIHEGVYIMLGGPTYETVAELRLLRMLGIDAVGNAGIYSINNIQTINISSYGIP